MPTTFQTLTLVPPNKEEKSLEKNKMTKTTLSVHLVPPPSSSLFSILKTSTLSTSTSVPSTPSSLFTKSTATTPSTATTIAPNEYGKLFQPTTMGTTTTTTTATKFYSSGFFSGSSFHTPKHTFNETQGKGDKNDVKEGDENEGEDEPSIL